MDKVCGTWPFLTSPNSMAALRRREIGLKERSLTQLFDKRAKSNFQHQRFVTKETPSALGLYSVEDLHVRYPYMLITAIVAAEETEFRGKIQLWLWNLQTSQHLWAVTFNVSGAHAFEQVTLKEDRVITCFTPSLPHSERGDEGSVDEGVVGATNSFKEALRIRIIELHTGKILEEHAMMRSIGVRCIVREKSYWILDKCIEKRAFDHSRKALISRRDNKRFEDIVYDNHLFYFAQDQLTIYDLRKKNKKVYEIPFAFENRRILFTRFDGACLLCVMTQEKPLLQRGHYLDYCVFDLATQTAIPLYQKESDDPSLKWASDDPSLKWAIDAGMINGCIHHQWVYLGYSSGHLVAVNWANHTSQVITQFQTPIASLDVQAGMLIAEVEPRRVGLHDFEGMFELAKLVVWDTRSLKEIYQMDWMLGQVKIVWADGKLVVASWLGSDFGSSIEVRDYSTSIEKEEKKS